MPRLAPRPSRATATRSRSRDVMNALRRIVRDLRLSARDAERAAGISGAQLFVLQALAEAPAASVNDLAERTLTDQSSVSVVVKRLVERGLVIRKSSRDDGRRVELGLTAAGRRLVARCPEPTQVRLLTAFRKMTAREMENLRRGVDALVREMGLDRAEAPMFFAEEPGQPAKR